MDGCAGESPEHREGAVMAAPVILDGDLATVLAAVRALVAERDKFRKVTPNRAEELCKV